MALINIDGQLIDSATVTVTAPRKFREAWKLNGSVIEIDETKLPQIKAKLKAAVDADAERVRLRYITAGDGQALTYRQKLEEAKAVQAGEGNPANVPVLAASVGIEAATLVDCANLVVARWDAWRTLANQIETARLQGKKNIDATGSISAADAAYTAIVWPA